MWTPSRVTLPALCLLGAALAGAQAPAPTPSPTRKAPAAKARTTPTPAASAEPSTERQKILYAMGALLGRPVASLALPEEDLAWVRQGLSDSAAGRPLRVSPDSFGPQLSDFTKKRLAEVAALQKMKDAPFFDREAALPGTVRQPSGLLYRQTRAGTKPGPGEKGQVVVSYTGSLTDGTVFDTSRTLGRPVVFDLEKVIPCWQKALPLMKAGGQARVVCPAELAWGEIGHPPFVKPGATVVYDVELVDVLK
jgi:FKBP-type peptidyl-prolyl cis-trans isomerase FkpA